jgi:hypothetical protein
MKRNSDGSPKLDEYTEVVEMTREEARDLWEEGTSYTNPSTDPLWEALDEAQGVAIEKVSFLIIRITP